jgi:hypothetical protein
VALFERVRPSGGGGSASPVTKDAAPFGVAAAEGTAAADSVE